MTLLHKRWDCPEFMTLVKKLHFLLFYSPVSFAHKGLNIFLHLYTQCQDIVNHIGHLEIFGLSSFLWLTDLKLSYVRLRGTDWKKIHMFEASIGWVCFRISILLKNNATSYNKTKERELLVFWIRSLYIVWNHGYRIW